MTGEIRGDNTDGIGLLRDLVINLGATIEGADILILGAGGATRGIVGPLLEMQPLSLCIANRTIEKAEALAEHFSHSGPVTACRFSVVPVTRNYDLIINATSAGHKGETPPYPAAAVSKDTLCYDLSYGLKPTPFSEWAREQGAEKIRDGLGHARRAGCGVFQYLAWRSPGYRARPQADEDNGVRLERSANSANLVALEPRLFVGAVTEWFVRGFPAAA